MKFDKSDKISAPMSPTYREWLCITIYRG